MKLTAISILVTLLFIFMGKTSLISQEQEEDAHVFAIVFYKIPFNELDEFTSFHEKEVQAIDRQIDEILSIKVFRHYWGPEWSIMEILEFKDLASMENAMEKRQELRNKRYPNKKDMEEFNKKRRDFLNGHFDALVREVPELRK
jgi:hypothetical protein